MYLANLKGSDFPRLNQSVQEEKAEAGPRAGPRKGLQAKGSSPSKLEWMSED